MKKSNTEEKSHDIRVGDVITFTGEHAVNGTAFGGTVVAVIENVVVYRWLDGTVESTDDPEAIVVLARPASAGTATPVPGSHEAKVLALTLLEHRDRDEGEERPDGLTATLPAIREGQRRVRLALELTHRANDLINWPFDIDGIGWGWADSVPANAFLTLIDAAEHEIECLERSTVTAVSVRENEDAMKAMVA